MSTAPGTARRRPATTGSPQRDGAPRSALQAARIGRGWSQPRAVQAIIQAGARLNIPLPQPESLKTQLSKWENGRLTPEPIYRRIFRQLYGLTDAELGFTDTPPTGGEQEADELSGRLLVARRVDTGLVHVLASHTHQLRVQDRSLGGAVLLDEMAGHVRKIEQLFGDTATGAQRATLAAVLADAAALAGWQALDTGAPRRAWSQITAARGAAQEAQRPELLANVLGQQSYVLLELGHTTDAADLITTAAELTGLPPLMRAWLAAARGELLAAAGNADDALRAFDTAHGLLPDDPHDPALPFVALDDVHLTRWRGNALARLARPEAIEHLSHALTGLHPSFVRAAASLRADLATAHARAGDRDQAKSQAHAARQLAIQIGSDRIRRRVERLNLPVPARDEQQ